MRLQPGHNPGLTFAIHHQASVIFFLAPGPSWAQGDLSLRDILTRPNLAQQQFPIFTERQPAAVCGSGAKARPCLYAQLTYPRLRN
jgi:hypothetical protein